MSLSFSINCKMYPRFILGNDWAFRHYQATQKEPHRDFFIEMFKAAYGCGVLGVDVNINSTNLFEGFVGAKNKYPDLIGIGDPNMGCGFHLRGVPLKQLRGRIISSIYHNYLPVRDKQIILGRDIKFLDSFFQFSSIDKPLSGNDIDEISIDRQLWEKRMKRLEGVCDFCLVGADYADWLILMGRGDLIKYQVQSIVEHKMIPISVSHWTSMTIPFFEQIPEIKGHWILANKESLFLSEREVYNCIAHTVKPLTGFRLFRKLYGYETIRKAIQWASNFLSVQSFVIGASRDLLAVRHFCSNVVESYFMLKNRLN